MNEKGCKFELVGQPSQSAGANGRPKEVLAEPVVIMAKGPERSNKGDGSSRIRCAACNSYPRGTSM